MKVTTINFGNKGLKARTKEEYIDSLAEEIIAENLPHIQLDIHKTISLELEIEEFDQSIELANETYRVFVTKLYNRLS